MITVLTLTYNRTHILEEAVYSFLQQKNIENYELLIINDKKDVKYTFGHPNVRIMNLETRFDSLTEKLMFGFQHSKYDYIYRLDDDDLLSGPDSLDKCFNEIQNNPGYDLYSSVEHYYLHDNYIKTGGSVNNGNIYNREFYLNYDLPPLSFAEDHYMVFDIKPHTYRYNHISMIYRWGAGTYHISGYGNIAPAKLKSFMDSRQQESGNKILNPHWRNNYWDKIQSYQNSLTITN